MRSRLTPLPYIPFLLLCAAALVPGCAVASPLVVNAGFPGENSAEIRARMDRELYAVHPTYVIVFAGMNDAVNERKFLPLVQTLKNVDAMLRTAQRANVMPVLVLVHHVDRHRLLARHPATVYGSTGPNGRIDALDAGLRKVAVQDGVRVADFRAALEKAGGATTALSTDGVHLTRQGYGILARTVLSALPSQIPPRARVLCLGDSLTYGIGVRPPGAEITQGNGAPYPTYPEQLRLMLMNRR